MSLADFQPQQLNCNRHTQKGMAMLDRSLSRDGWIGAISCAADGEVFDGSARLETVYDRFGDVEPIVIRTSGDRPVIHIREDIPSATDEKAIRLGISANRTPELNLNWDAALLDGIDDAIDLSEFFSTAELDRLTEEAIAEMEALDDAELREVKDRYSVMVICRSADEQTQLIDRLSSEGLRVRKR